MAATRFENTLFHYERALGRALTADETLQIQSIRGKTAHSFNYLAARLKAGKRIWSENTHTKKETVK